MEKDIRPIKNTYENVKRLNELGCVTGYMVKKGFITKVFLK